MVDCIVSYALHLHKIHVSAKNDQPLNTDHTIVCEWSYSRTPFSLKTDSVLKKINERWQVGVALSPSQHFQQVSFVNSINTSRVSRKKKKTKQEERRGHVGMRVVSMQHS